MARRTLDVLGLLGTTLDAGKGDARWDRWRPTVALTQQEDLLVDRLELLHGAESGTLATVTGDIAHASPETTVVPHLLELPDPWDFERVFAALHDFATAYPFDTDREDYLVHITTGTHVAQICLFLLTESRYFPARLLQTSPEGRTRGRGPGSYAIIDLDLSRYDRLASRFQTEKTQAESFLKSGIATKSPAFNALIEQVERVAIGSRAPILLTGPTGAGKSKLARRIFELKRAKRQVTGELSEVNCATLRGDTAMSTLFGHTKGAFTGAVGARAGLLMKAHRGVLFLDEIGELGLDEQAMLLRAVEERVFLPVGSDREISSDFQLIAGTNRDLAERIAAGKFREDLLARIDLWTFDLPALHERPEDIGPNLDFELSQSSRTLEVKVTMSRDARQRFTAFSSTRVWPGNFRDFNGSVTRMATLAKGGRITEEIVAEEIARLEAVKRGAPGLAARVLGAQKAQDLDRFDRIQLEDVLAVCLEARSLSAAGRELFAASRVQRTSVNDADRLRKYLARFGLEFDAISR